MYLELQLLHHLHLDPTLRRALVVQRVLAVQMSAHKNKFNIKT